MTTDSPPVSDFHSASVTNGITGCSSLSSTSSTAASTSLGVLGARAAFEQLGFRGSRYQSQNSSHAKWYSASQARLNS